MVSRQDGTGSWPAPRGERGDDGTWNYTLQSRPLFERSEPSVEGIAVGNYRRVVARLQVERATRGETVRSLARAAGLSLSVTNNALSGSSWPRWPSLEALASALGTSLAVSGAPGHPVIETLLEVERARGGRPLRVALHQMGRLKIDGPAPYHVIQRSTGRQSARDVGVRPSTFYDLAKAGRAPSSALVFALAALNTRSIAVEP